jgi:2-(1,2-epoxy-1,2-dihydrophenyl)acetyl-CoA isomerase
VIAAVEGHAAGAGLCIAAACDVVVASREAKLSCTFNKIGLFPDLGGAWSIPLRMGLGRAKLLMMTGPRDGRRHRRAAGPGRPAGRTRSGAG